MVVNMVGIVNKVVVRFKDGVIMKGQTSDFFPNKKEFHLEVQPGEIVSINTNELKAVFFVKDLEGDKNRKDMYGDIIAGGGKKIEVQFADGEVIVGFSQGYSPDRIGFFFIPADKKGNNDRIFVVTSATKKITLL
ncbi:MAG: hypothetical protein KAJ10_15695 [Thermodesulfovibrionia bacterium]|nr:hypothetical protein [Thermodesulfovibrionia bacterium]